MGIFTDDIRRRLNERNQNALILMVGEPGSGKSVNSGSICHDIDPTFDINSLPVRMAKSPKEFIDFTDQMKGGQMLMWDEAGVGLSASEWWEQANLLVNYVLQTFRHENIGTIFTAPQMKDVDSKTRSRFHYILEVTKIDYRSNIAKVKVRRRKHNQLLGKTYYPRLTKKYGNITLMLHEIEVPLMPPDVLAKYESIAKPWKRELKEDVKQQLAELGKGGGLTDQEIVNQIVSVDPSEFMSKKGKLPPRLDKDIIEFKFRIGARRSTRIVKAVMRQQKANTKRANKKIAKKQK